MPTHGGGSSKYPIRSGVSSPNDTGIPVGINVSAPIRYPDLNLMRELITPWDPAGLTLIDIPTRIQGAKTAYQAFRIWVLSYRDHYWTTEIGFQMFIADWRTFRLTIPLQMRLLVEQVLYDLDYPWRNGCSGFGPLK